MANRTPSGAPSQEARDKYGASGGRFPIFDRKSALAALQLRGRAKSQTERDNIIKRARKYAPEEAKKAWATDHPKGKG